MAWETPPAAAAASSASRLGREQVAGLLAEIDAGGTLHMVGELEEMAGDTDHITHEESERLASESRAARTLDQHLAGGLRHRRLGGETSSAGYLRELGGRPRLPGAVERRLVEAAQAGDRRAREQLVEAFLPLIAGVARVYRGSPTITRLELCRRASWVCCAPWSAMTPRSGCPSGGTRPMVLSDRALRQLSQLRRAHSEYVVEHGREPNTYELADSSGLTPEQAAEMLALERVPKSLDEPVRGEGESSARSVSCSVAPMPLRISTAGEPKTPAQTITNSASLSTGSPATGAPCASTVEQYPIDERVADHRR
jgi:hypothetical protein